MVNPVVMSAASPKLLSVFADSLRAGQTPAVALKGIVSVGAR